MRNDLEKRLLKRLLESGDGAAMFVYLFASEWGYPPTVGTRASVAMDKGTLMCLFNDAACLEWEAASTATQLTSGLMAHVEINLMDMLRPKDFN